MSGATAFPVGAVIVGAGAGKRFGGPKAVALLPDGRRFIDVVCETAARGGLAPIVAVLPPGISAPADVAVVVNPRADGEQVVSIQLGLARLANTPCVGAIVWPVDHPFISPETILAIVACAHRTGAPIIAPELDGRRGHPVFFHRDTWRELLTVPHGGARAVVRSYGSRAVTVPVPDAGIRRNIDTQADLATG